MLSGFCMSGLQVLYTMLGETLTMCIKGIIDRVTCVIDRVAALSPLEIASCVVLTESSSDDAYRIVLALLVLVLAALNWHVHT